jgi:hypothetical protein
MAEIGAVEVKKEGDSSSLMKALFGLELVSTQGDIAEADVSNVTWTGSSILSRRRVCSTVSLLPLKKIVSYWCKSPMGYYGNVPFPNNAKS